MLEMGAGSDAMYLHFPSWLSNLSAVFVSICPLLPATAYTRPPDTVRSKRPRFSSMGSISDQELEEGS